MIGPMRSHSVKVVATLGPASDGHDRIAALARAGVDMFRLNFSHGSHDEHRARISVVRAVEAEIGRPIAVLGDLQGPKLRVGRFVDGRATLRDGQRYRFDLADAPGDDRRAPLPHPEIFQALEVGTDLLLNDGRIRVRVLEVGTDSAETEVITGGDLSDNKGVNVPNVVLPVSAMTPKDRRDLAFALDLGVDWLALSFVQRPEDMAEARKLTSGRVALMAKLEKPSAIEHLDEIIEISDGIMVARGDLGVEVPPETVPIIQKRIVRACRAAGRPVVVATQMLESMIGSPAPTRAEASDVATAMYDGADAVMLSGETAVGQYPVQSVTMMRRIIARVRDDDLYRAITNTARPQPEPTAADAISAAARQVAETLRAATIVTFTTSGSTALRVSRERPAVPILCLTADLRVARRLAVVWGVQAKVIGEVSAFAEVIEQASRFVLAEGWARAGQRLVIVAGVPFGTPGTTNLLRIAFLDDNQA